MKSMKETASSVAASGKAGIEKTKASLQEKAEKMSAHDPVQKEMAREKKEERKAQAELEKQETKSQNAAARNAASAAGGQGHYNSGGTEPYVTTGHETRTYSASGVPGRPTGTQQMSVVPGHGTGEPYGGQVDDEGVVRTQPSGLPGETMGHNTRVAGTGTGANAAGYERRV